MKKRLAVTLLGTAMAGFILLTGCAGSQAESTAVSSAPAVTSAPATATPTPEATQTATPTPTPAPTVAPENTEPIPEGKVKSYLTGEYVSPEIGRRRPVSFMIDNDGTTSVPQSGLSAASIYYEAPAEGDATRMCVVFENYDDQKRIGPLRSCRDYFISFVSGLDPIYEHYGRAAYALPYLESDSVDNISGLLSSTYDCFYRDYTFHSGYHTAYIGASGIEQAIKIRGYSQQYKEGFTPMYQFAWVGQDGSDVSGGRDASYIKMGYVNNSPSMVYNADDGLYYRYEFGTELVDAENNQQIAVKNVILEFENWDYYLDTAAYNETGSLTRSHYLHFDTTAGGKGVYIRDGKAIDITWERKSFYEPVHYYDASGKEIVLNTGKTWVDIVPNDRLGECLIGASKDSASTVVSAEEVAAAKTYITEWRAAYEYTEPQYLAGMAAELKQELAAHGGQTKVGEGDG